MEQAANKHGPREDDALKASERGLIQGNHEPRAEEWREQEPAGETQPEPDRNPDGTFVGGTPPGMSERDVNDRSELARYLDRDAFPADRDALLSGARDNNAPDSVVAEIRRLPSGREFGNVQEIWSELGGGVERQRF